MLDKNALHQLSQLRKDIHDSQERHTATVKGTQWRYGFAKLDSGRQIFIPPDEMLKVFPGDKVQILVKLDDKNKVIAEVEQLNNSELSQLTGQVKRKGKNWFIVPDLPNLGRWLFVPPRQLSGAKDNDFVQCKISQHPFKNGKPQVKIIKVIGSESDVGIEHNYTLQKYGLHEDWPQDILDSLPKDCERILEQEQAKRDNLTSLPFITIDSIESMDLDDALHIAKTDLGWQLSVAIADPSEFIAPNSKLEQLSRDRMTSVYLLGKTLPMLPEALSNNFCSLLPNENRLALICQLNINEQGETLATSFRKAVIRSHERLSYEKAANVIDGSASKPVTEEISEQLTELWKIRHALFNNRKKNNLVMEDKPDYKLHLNEKQKISHIQKTDKNNAHRLVEECMLAVNTATANYLRDHTDSALYIGHIGFKNEKLDNVTKLIAQSHPDYTTGDLQQLERYKALIQHVENSDSEIPVYTILSKMLERSTITDKPTAHMGMGLECYTTFTSPIRKYHDFMVHRIIKSLIDGQTTDPVPSDTIAKIQEKTLKAKQASNQLEQWLKCQFIAERTDKTYSATIAHIHSRGINVRLDDYDIQGHIDAKTLQEKYKYDPILMALQLKNRCFTLNQSIAVKVVGIDHQKKIAQLALIEQ